MGTEGFTSRRAEKARSRGECSTADINLTLSSPYLTCKTHIYKKKKRRNYSSLPSANQIHTTASTQLQDSLAPFKQPVQCEAVVPHRLYKRNGVVMVGQSCVALRR